MFMERGFSGTPKQGDVYQSMWGELSAQRPWSGRLLNRKKDGALYLAELTISPVVDAQGKTTHFLGMHRDVSEMHRIERVAGN
jgi:PAS domain S-box-containing protein